MEMQTEAASWNPAFRPNHDSDEVSPKAQVITGGEFGSKSDALLSQTQHGNVMQQVQPVTDEPANTGKGSDIVSLWDNGTPGRTTGSDLKDGSVNASSTREWINGTESFQNQQSSVITSESAGEASSGWTFDNNESGVFYGENSMPASSGYNAVNESDDFRSGDLAGPTKNIDNTQPIKDVATRLTFENDSDPFAASQDTWELEGGSSLLAAEPKSSVNTLGTDDEWGLSDHNFDLGGSNSTANPTSHHTTAERSHEQSHESGINNQINGDGQNQDNLAEMWKAALGDDDFLEETNETASQDPFADISGNSFSDNSWLGASHDTNMNSYQISNDAPQTKSQPHQQQPRMDQSMSFNNFGAYNFPGGPTGQPHKRQDMPQLSRAESYSDKSKGGYHSPYDLPTGIAKPRKRPSINPSFTSTSTTSGRNGLALPPPRSSSIVEHPSQYKSSTSASSSQLASHDLNNSEGSPNAGNFIQEQQKRLPSAISRTSSSGFFSDLPPTPTVRQSSTAGRYAPQVASRTPTAPPPSAGLPLSQATQVSSQNQTYSNSSQQVVGQGQSQAFALQPSTYTGQPTAPPAQQPSRYSPAPVPAATRSTSYAQMPATRANRYSPAPSAVVPSAAVPTAAAPPTVAIPSRDMSSHTAIPQSMQAVQPFAPRTSSPLVHSADLPQEPVNDQAVHSRQISNAAKYARQGSPLHDFGGLPSSDHTRNNEVISHSPPTVLPHRPIRGDTKTPPTLPPSTNISPLRSYIPEKVAQPREAPSDRITSPLQNEKRRSRDAPVAPTPQIGITNDAATTVRVSSHQLRRTITQGLEYIVPNDSRADDPLQRWRGCPIFHWGLGGNILLHFPQEVPRYGAGHAIPMIQCSQGEVTIHTSKILSPLSDSVTSFPGPLKGKNKKKDLGMWLDTTIKSMQAQLESSNLDNLLPPDVRQRSEEKLLLWKVMQLLVEHNGSLEGSPEISAAVARILAESEPENGMIATSQEISSSTADRSDVASQQAIHEIRRNLLDGEREKAVWYAADQGLWAHAMLVSSTLSKDVWKQVIQEFARQDVKKAGESAESLAALYQVFAGNWEESIDELVPPSERAGFQMIRKDSSNPARHALQGLERWRETVRLIMNNRSNDDHRALNALGKLLASYGRAEAAHICHLFAASLSKFGGVDEPDTDIVLLGVDHLHHSIDLDLDMEAVLLTETYEYALSLAASPAPALPHLQLYKLRHSMALAEHGLRSESQQYCDAINAAIKATARPSPYYHANFISQLDDLSQRLSKSPKDSTASWIPKPSMEKVSGSMWAKFNNFVAGDDSDKASADSKMGPADSAPLTNFAEAPSSYAPVPNDNVHPLYSSSIPQPVTSFPPTASRYTPLSSQANPPGVAPAGLGGYIPSSNLSQAMVADAPSAPHPVNQPVQDVAQTSFSPPKSRYSPLPHQPVSHQTASYQPQAPEPRMNLNEPNSFTPMSVDVTEQMPLATAAAPNNDKSSYFPNLNANAPLSDNAVGQTNLAANISYEPLTGGYEPPSSYEPPSYQPYVPEQENGEDMKQDQSKRGGAFNDDDDDEIVRKAEALKKQQMAQADREADDAFKKAAEADGKFNYITVHHNLP